MAFWQSALLAQTLNDFTLMAADKMRVDAVFIGLAKAFDSVFHDKSLIIWF